MQQVDGGGGLALWLTGLPGSGKSTLGRALATCLAETDRRLVTILDGDVVRTVLSRGVGFSKIERCDNVRRIGFAAALIVRHGGIALSAVVSPYRETRAEVREMVEQAGGVFVEIHVDSPFRVCVGRDPKGHYARALAGDLDHFTGVDDPYEKPLAPDVRLETQAHTLSESTRIVMHFLHTHGWLVPFTKVADA